ncbi:HypC/HybG/HupF family hydrogenase formation chaperone [Sporolactobacillus sp. Y61]|uniref:HypC/HybG/HupF family hydrogenase formation chaperone n=1 Tax=Sporolactobacillus sp. Y61 TaxID=3160863 RepID=A0AAU8IJE8_9BACL
MCVGVPAKVIKKKDYTALVDVMGTRMEVGILFVPEVQTGEYVIVHAGQGMSIVDRDFARASINEWEKMAHANVI